MSIRDNVLTAVVTALNTDRPGNVPAARRRRFSAMETASLPVIDVAPVKEHVAPVGGRAGPLVKRSLEFVVRVWTSGDAPEIKADVAAAWATKALANNRLGGLVHDIEEMGTEWQARPMDSVFGATEIHFLAQYQTKTTDQEATA